MKLFSTLFSLMVALLLAVQAPAEAATTKLKNNLNVTGNLTVDGTSTITGGTTFSGNLGVGGNLAVTGTSLHTGVATFTLAPVLTTATITASGDTYTIPDVGDASFVMTAGTQTIGGAKTFSTAPVFSTTLLKASIGNSSKRFTINVPINAGTALADGTTYQAFVVPGRAGTVTKISAITEVVPGGTNTLKVLKGSSAGNTMFSAASFDPATLTANQATAMTLTGTGSDLTVTASGANSGIYVQWVAGTQTTAAKAAAVSIEFEPDEY